MTTMESNGYNGWSNRATWNTHLWISNLRGVYKIIEKLLFDSRNSGDFIDSLEGYLQLVWDGKTPDGEDLNKVRWSELGESIITDHEMTWEDYQAMQSP